MFGFGALKCIPVRTDNIRSCVINFNKNDNTWLPCSQITNLDITVVEITNLDITVVAITNLDITVVEITNLNVRVL